VTSDRLARAYGARPVRDLVQHLNDRSEVALAPPGVGAYGPFADSCIHMRDVAIPLGIATSPPVQDWTRVLAPVTGTSEALAMSLTGRPALLDDLAGAGVPMLRQRVLAQQP
jgi:hypothetical protein